MGLDSTQELLPTLKMKLRKLQERSEIVEELVPALAPAEALHDSEVSKFIQSKATEVHVKSYTLRPSLSFKRSGNSRVVKSSSSHWRLGSALAV